ncbi:universal stress protein [Coleofasciculus sp. H7-2]|uniref:universal stress protein n=1 Tax=Coleofasciculus sp. H7-2 TaxID=3351545 RepID=UPI00366ED7A3
MNIKSMLARLESAMGRQNVVEQMVLLPEPASLVSKRANSAKSINLVVGYNRSPSSQTALDIALWIAHQTRLVTKAQVTVQVVYVVDEDQSSHCPHISNGGDTSRPSIQQLPLSLEASAVRSATPVLTQPTPAELAARTRMTEIDPSYLRAIFYQTNPFAQADRILSQARCLAEEWRGSFKAHLRFGCVSTELKKVVELEAATLLLLGCTSVNNPIVQELSSNLPCAVLGIPTILNSSDSSNCSSDFQSV